jgi:hypothetical protein
LRTSGQARRGEAFRTPPGSKDSNGKEVYSGAAGSLPGHFLFMGYSGYNLLMSSNLIKIIIAAVIGIALGIVYGWVIDPVEFTNLTPSLLREDYRADYVLMVAEAYHGEINADVAARRLAVVSSEAPAVIVTNTLDYAHLNGFTPSEISLLQELLSAMQIYQPQDNPAP